MGRAKFVQKILTYTPKYGQKFLIHSNAGAMENFFCKAEFVTVDGKKVLSPECRATMGDIALFLEAKAASQQAGVLNYAKDIFTKADNCSAVVGRSKSACSAETKLERALLESKNQTFNSLSEACENIADANGIRVFMTNLEKLSDKQINKMIRKLRIDDQPLTENQMKLLSDYIYERPIKSSKRDEAFALYEQFAQPLIEKRSKGAVDKMVLGILKQRINMGEISKEDLLASGFFDMNLLNRLSTESINPMDVKRITNYRGRYGLPDFSNDQIEQLVKALDYKNKGKLIPVYSDPRGLTGRKYPKQEMQFYYDRSIKSNGYHSTQINILGKNGEQVEMQFRGQESNPYCEVDHLGYDFSMGKNTIGEECEEFTNALEALSAHDKILYNEYKHGWFNYFQRLELGLPAKMPKLNIKFNEILSTDSNFELYNKIHRIQEYESVKFYPHIIKNDIAVA